MTESIPRHINDVMTACRASGSQCHAQIANYACALCKYGDGNGPVSTGVSSVNVRIPSDTEATAITHQKPPIRNGWHFPAKKPPFRNGWHPELIPSGMGCEISKENCFMREWHPAMARSGLSPYAFNQVVFLDEDLMF